MPQTPRLEVGDKAPAFSLPDADGNTVKLSDYKGRRVIVYFYPAASTPGCTKQACDFRDNLAVPGDTARAEEQPARPHLAQRPLGDQPDERTVAPPPDADRHAQPHRGAVAQTANHGEAA